MNEKGKIEGRSWGQKKKAHHESLAIIKVTRHTVDASHSTTESSKRGAKTALTGANTKRGRRGK